MTANINTAPLLHELREKRRKIILHQTNLNFN